MNSKKSFYRIISIALTLMLLIGAVPLAAFAEDSQFVSENLLETNLESAAGIIFYSQTSTAVEDPRFDSKGALAGSTDGNISVPTDMYAYNETTTNWIGALYTLGTAEFCEKVTIYSGFPNLKDYYRIYASDDLATLYSGSNMVAASLECDGTAKEITLNRTVKYLAVIYDNISAGASIARISEFQLWSGDESIAFISENALRTNLASAEAVIMDPASGAVSPSEHISETQLARSTDGNTDSHYDISDAPNWPQPKYIGFLYTLNDSVYIDKATLHSGLTTHTDIYRVYASDSLETLYSESNIIADDVECSGVPVDVSVNKFVKYVAFFCTGCVGSQRPKEFELWTGDPTNVFITENLLVTSLKSATGIAMYLSNGNISNEDIFNTEIIKILTDGDTANHKDVGNAIDWEPKRYPGILYELDDTYLANKATLYAGIANYADTYRVYASDNLENLYSDASIVGNDIVCETGGQDVSVQKPVKYLAIFCTAYRDNPRVREFELWSGDPALIFTPENLFQTDLSATETFHMSATTGTVGSGTKFDQNEAIYYSTDTDKETKKAVYDCIDGWEYPVYAGALYTVGTTTYTGRLDIYASGTFKIFAADALDMLYSDSNCIADNLSVGSFASIKIERHIKYVAIFCVGYAEIAELELWSAEPEEGPAPVNSLKVLTIGNSFSENTSVYASEIAYAQGKSLTFGYLKFPSCTIAQHYTAATENLAVFKFQITAPDGTRTTIKTEAPSFADNPDSSATIAEALEYTDWDVIVFQQESSNARNIDSYSDISGLVEYVKGYCPDASLAIHEVWRWGIWDKAQYDLIKANTAAVAAQNNLIVIPTGTAFEIARSSIEDDTALNDYDNGYYQHANALGQYVAGACYVAKLFGISINENTFTSHPYVNANNNVALLTAAVNSAVSVSALRGDVNADGYVNAQDLIDLRGVLLGTITDIAGDCDVNGDEVINIKDLVNLKKLIAEA